MLSSFQHVLTTIINPEILKLSIIKKLGNPKQLKFIFILFLFQTEANWMPTFTHTNKN